MGIFHFGRPPVVGGYGFIFKRIDEEGGAGGISVSACDIGTREGLGIAAAAYFDSLCLSIYASEYGDYQYEKGLRKA